MYAQAYTKWNELSTKVSVPIRKIAIFLPHSYRGGSFNGAKNIAKMIHLGSRNRGAPVEVIFSCYGGYYQINEDFRDLLEMGIAIRETYWDVMSNEETSVFLEITRKKHVLNEAYYTFPRDNINDFYDCDFWLLISDRFQYPLLPVKPYGLVIYDYIQRYVPQIFPVDFQDMSYLTTAREANFVLTTTPSTRGDAIQYAGLSPNRVFLVPMEFNPLICEFKDQSNEEDYFIWTTNTTEHKNHINAIHALDIYYRKLNGSLKVIMTGATIELFLSNDHQEIEYVKRVSELMEKTESCKRNLKIMGNLSTEDYISLLSKARFLWHPTLIDNGTYSVIEAAYYGVPSLSHDYQQMRFINERFQLNLQFCNGNDPYDMAVNLKEMEENNFIRQKLPSKKFLENFNYTMLANEYWQLLESLIQQSISEEM